MLYINKPSVINIHINRKLGYVNSLPHVRHTSKSKFYCLGRYAPRNTIYHLLWIIFTIFNASLRLSWRKLNCVHVLPHAATIYVTAYYPVFYLVATKKIFQPQHVEAQRAPPDSALYAIHQRRLGGNDGRRGCPTT